MSDLIIYNSASIVDSFFNEIYNEYEINNNKFIIFIDWKNTMVNYKNDGTVILRNDNGYIYESYNNIIKDKNCKGFFIINHNADNVDEIQNYVDSFSIDTEYIFDLNKIDNNNVMNNGVYSIDYSYILSPLNENVRYHMIIDSFLNDNYINIRPLLKNKLSIYIITSNIYNIFDIILFSTNGFHICYFQTYIDEKLFIKKFGKAKNNSAVSCDLFGDIIDKFKSSWNS
ncbi:unknown similar to AMEV200 [Mythimna separata entomopoxvirus 'L']|uniref:Uncharacterized protein n=1 Tax=Mythimna separata entomopoxvirus 'L' TaxID=1293572 RepID=A0A916NYK4_9POXV|nr:unknown similar to AMEV200 [Mythimna separata entomopoxvirus 'L']CCU56423.1 unknown similar to AMEV200 [Mythimna separata entomopoxvirus 'L']